jgi:hypothetical protein
MFGRERITDLDAQDSDLIMRSPSDTDRGIHRRFRASVTSRPSKNLTFGGGLLFLLAVGVFTALIVLGHVHAQHDQDREILKLKREGYALSGDTLTVYECTEQGGHVVADLCVIP